MEMNEDGEINSNPMRDSMTDISVINQEFGELPPISGQIMHLESG